MRNLLVRLLKLQPDDAHLHVRLAQLLEQRIIHHYARAIQPYVHALAGDAFDAISK